MSGSQDKVAAWIAKQGFPLEMKVAEILGEAGIHADHYRVYEDLETQKSREIDVMGYFDHEKLSVHLVFECKHSKDKPWILFSTARKNMVPRGYVMSVPATEVARGRIEQISDESIVQEMNFFHAPNLLGFQLLRAFTNNQDSAFHAVSGLSGACLSIAEDIGRGGHRVLFVPILVVDSPLFQCHLPEGSSEIELSPILHGAMLHTHAVGHRVLIQIVHIDALTEYVVEAIENSMVLNELVY